MGLSPNEIATTHDIDMLRVNLTNLIQELKDLITGALADDKYVNLSEAMELSGYRSAGGFYKFVERCEIRFNLLGSNKKAYNKYDILKHSKSKRQ